MGIVLSTCTITFEGTHPHGIRELETELRGVEKERAAKVRELKKLRTRLEDVLSQEAQR
jgi:mediator of RNA polymerase II transcription subunit 21